VDSYPRAGGVTLLRERLFGTPGARRFRAAALNGLMIGLSMGCAVSCPTAADVRNSGQAIIQAVGGYQSLYQR
jgi:hypothetical protein